MNEQPSHIEEEVTFISDIKDIKPQIGIPFKPIIIPNKYLNTNYQHLILPNGEKIRILPFNPYNNSENKFVISTRDGLYYLNSEPNSSEFKTFLPYMKIRYLHNPEGDSIQTTYEFTDYQFDGGYLLTKERIQFQNRSQIKQFVENTYKYNPNALKQGVIAYEYSQRELDC